LSELYARRARAKANTYDCDPATMDAFSAAFAHTHTPDQQTAIRAIAADMQSAKVMDRLICGDVGYGKTEVAFHAIFRAVMSGFQAAILCPTTVLSVQHANTARERFAPFGIRVEVLNRFKTESESESILKDLRTGKIDIIVGTHRLLSSDVKFKNMGLLVLDEEQRFGVGHKEKIKQLKTNVDVLTLSATPIPRTLNMALIGIRDISVISTPPVNRYPVITYVTEFSEMLLLDAVIRENERAGQTIVLYNDVEHIEAFAARLRRGLADAGHGGIRVGVIHGQMRAEALEDTIVALSARRIDVMVASTLLAHGLDLSAANPLFALDADRLGVAQMHQLRGRVGRSDRQAYAYFTYGGNKTLSEVSRARLEAIRSFTGGGAGLQIAMKDLQLRGAGSLLGANQSGHMEQIGFDMYCKILEEVARENRSETDIDAAGVPVIQEAEAVLNLALNCFIPHTYIENEDERMKVYIAISEVKNRADAAKIIANLTDLYGHPPAEVANIVTAGLIRAAAAGKSIRLISHNREGARISFHKSADQYPIVARIKANPRVSYTQGPELTVKLRTPTVQGLVDFLEKL
jgi:transcription-repair coupling factor (superfamily II helicase)